MSAVRGAFQVPLILLCRLYDKGGCFVSNSYAAAGTFEGKRIRTGHYQMSTVSYEAAARSSASNHSTLDSHGLRRLLQSSPQTELPDGIHSRAINRRLELSESRAYKCALSILGAYKLTGHFPTELEILLRDLGVLDKVRYEIEPKAPLSDLRHVTFRPNDNVHADRFREIMRLVNDQIGFDATLSWWARLFRYTRRKFLPDYPVSLA
jgi:hypothetical protein